MISGEHVYQSIIGHQRYSTNRVKNSIFEEAKYVNPLIPVWDKGD